MNRENLEELKLNVSIFSGTKNIFNYLFSNVFVSKKKFKLKSRVFVLKNLEFLL